MTTDIVERLRDVSIYLGDAIAGYRNDDLKRAARGAVDIARTTQEAAAVIEQLRTAMREIEALDDRSAVSSSGLFMRALLIARRALEPKT